MKKRSFWFLLLFVVATIFWAPVSTLAQDCAGYYLLKNNTEYELINYDKKDKLTGRVLYKVTSVNSSPGKTEATIHSKILDEKGKLTTEGDYTVSCQDGSMLIDMRSMVNPDMLAAYQNMEVKMEGDQMDYPSTLTTGQKLKDGTISIDVLDKQSGQPLTSMVMTITGRTVGNTESINVPAGAYNAFKINQDLELQTKAMGMKMPATRMQTIEYFVPGVGLVRTETYRNGKLLAYSVLNRISN
ncbi:TapB family protein [Pontibacter fetidus]|uniref:DUF3108 domain-containing protein n=1 Tax=Pontibacter fetidus TaxID=2700082 RepID=A0A6B2HAJ0_9BACT|nr:hypothetical protein [Pontibacter fetidus]NDK56464.1 hypothetical protein [Pontibacter fetidus]